MERGYLYQTLFLLYSAASALPQTQTETSPSSAFPTMSAQDGFGVAEGGVGSSINAETGNGGSDGGSWSLSTGGIIGISVGIAVVVIAIAGMWVLWYMAKKRQWKIRESIKRASRRFTGRKVPPRTPRAAPPGHNANRRGTVHNKPSAMKMQHKDVDLEKGAASRHQKPSPGWLAAEKERSRSRSPDEEVKEDVAQAGGFMKKFGFGKR